jgi:hypothetical protein
MNAAAAAPAAHSWTDDELHCRLLMHLASVQLVLSSSAAPGLHDSSACKTVQRAPTYAAAAATAAGLQDKYVFAQCKRVLPVSAVRELGVPLPPAEVEVLEEDLTWDDVQVGASVISCNSYNLKSNSRHALT